MNIAVPIKLVPDLVEELEIDEAGKGLDTTCLRLVLNEVDGHAIEQALLLKEGIGAEVTVLSLEGEGTDDELFAAAAKGADRLVKLTGVTFGVNNHALARLYGSALREMRPDLVLTGVQAHDDLDGSLGPLLAEELRMPYVGYVSGLERAGGEFVARKEYPDGLVAEMAVAPPAVIGIQTAEEPPRYVAVSRVRQAAKAATIEEQPAPPLDTTGGPVVAAMFKPAAGERATMIAGSDDEVAARIAELLVDLGATGGER